MYLLYIYKKLRTSRPIRSQKSDCHLIDLYLFYFGAKHITKLPVIFLKRQVKFPFFMKKGNFCVHNDISMLNGIRTFLARISFL